MGRRLGKSQINLRFSLVSFGVRTKVLVQLPTQTYYLRIKAGRLVFYSCEVRLMDERARKNAEMSAFNSNNGAAGWTVILLRKITTPGVASKNLK